MPHPNAITQSVIGTRHTKNDDFSLINQEHGIYIICDGVSEGDGGNFASEFVAKCIQDELIKDNLVLQKDGASFLGPKRLEFMQEGLFRAFVTAQQNLVTMGENNQNYKYASTTCIALWMHGRFGILGHIGDSRAFLYRGGSAYQLTKDHNLLEELLESGMSREEAMKNPQAKSLTRCCGNSTCSKPDPLKIEFQPGDNLLLCTDGVYPTFAAPAMQKDLSGVLEGKDLKPFLEKCAKQTGDDATMIHVSFPANLQRESLISASDRIKLIQQAPLSKYFDYIQNCHVAAMCDVQEFKKGSVVIQEGTEGECMYIVAKGSLEVLLSGQHLNFRGPGEFIGEVGLIHNHTQRIATVVAKEDSTLLSLKRSFLVETFKTDKKLERSFYKAMTEVVLARMIDLGDEVARLKSH